MRTLTVLLAFVLAAATQFSEPASAQSSGGFFKSLTAGFTDDSNKRRLVATIWVDPDGCEHWVMDDGIEGYMSAHLDREGKPVCRAVPPSENTCLTLDSSTSFASGSAVVTASARTALRNYFNELPGKRIIVNGHTDSVGDERFNMDLSFDRATAVAAIGQSMGVLTEPRGFGENKPVASNKTSQGRAQNRRVELSCS